MQRAPSRAGKTQFLLLLLKTVMLQIATKDTMFAALFVLLFFLN